MADKQIIIDGVDVISCNHFDMNFKHCDILGRLCREHNNCYYKQLKAKEQECEELKGCLFQVQNATISLTKQLDQLKFDYVELEKRHNDSFEQFNQLKATNENLLSVQYKLADNNKKLRQTLTEIKELCREIEKFAERINEDNWGILDWKIIDKSRKILQKISEVEDENCLTIK